MTICVWKSLQLMGRQAKTGRVKGGMRAKRERGRTSCYLCLSLQPRPSFSPPYSSQLISTLPSHASFLPSPYPLLPSTTLAASTVPLSPNPILIPLLVPSLPISLLPAPAQYLPPSQRYALSPILPPVNLLPYYQP